MLCIAGYMLSTAPLYPSMAGEVRWDGKNLGVSLQDLIFLHERQKYGEHARVKHKLFRMSSRLASYLRKHVYSGNALAIALTRLMVIMIT